MKKTLLLALFAVFCVTASFAQPKSFWSNISYERAKDLGEVKETFEGITTNLFQVNLSQLKNTLATAPDRFSGGQGIIIAIPNIDGKPEHYRIFEASNFDPELQAQFPDIRAYAGYGIEDPTAILRLSVSHKNVQTMVLRADKPTEFIEPFNTNASVYAVFSSGMKSNTRDFTCYQEDENPGEEINAAVMQKSALSDDSKLRTFRLALSCTGEYAQYHGGEVADALAGMNATMTRVNGVYERDLAVRLNLIANTTEVIYTNPNTDPYTNMGSWSWQLQSTLNSEIGPSNYDIGHLFGASGGGGYAGCIGCVCDDQDKGSGYTAPGVGGPEGDFFDIDYVAHEMGHQLGANHTFTYSFEGTLAQVEPGSGSTIMGYAGITQYNVQEHSDDYFTYRSIEQIQDNLQDKFCATVTNLNNPAMTINAGPNYNIPKGTPFVLRAVNTESNSSNVTYTWEQNDLGNNTVTGSNSDAYPTKQAGPNFRSLPPTSSPNRYMPSLSTVLNNNLTTTWESVSDIARTLNFTLTGRDNVAGAGQTETDAMQVFVKTGAGPFKVTSQNTEGISWAQGSTQTITWDVAGTTANTINTANVNILLSTDGGQTFTTVLAANTPNDGSEVITVPNVAAPFCRIMVEAAGNIFYAVNTTPFAVGYTVTTTCNTYTNSTFTPIPDGANNYSTSVINVADNVVISDVNVGINITHSYVGDLALVLVSPAGTQVFLWQGECGNANNINATFDNSGLTPNCGPTTGNVLPQGSLAEFNGQSSQGQWVLGFVDGFTGDSGTLNEWSVEICSQTIQPLSADEFNLENFSIYPNPNNGSFTVAFTSGTADDINITVHDMRGRQIFSNSYKNTGLFSGEVNLSAAETGVYLVTIADGVRKVAKKIVVN